MPSTPDPDVPGARDHPALSVALYRRDPISADPAKRRLYNREAYHWGLLVDTGSSLDAYDATDRNNLDLTTFRQENPRGIWWLNRRPDYEWRASKKLLGRVAIGRFPPAATRDHVRALLEGVPMPAKHGHPQESCVTWVANAVRACREAGCSGTFDIDEFMDWALAYADRRLADPDETKEFVEYGEDVNNPA